MSSQDYCLVFGTSATHMGYPVKSVTRDTMRAMTAATLCQLVEFGMDPKETVLVATMGTGMNFIPIDLFQRGLVKDVIIVGPEPRVSGEMREEHRVFSLIYGDHGQRDTAAELEALAAKVRVVRSDHPDHIGESINHFLNNVLHLAQYAICLTMERGVVEPAKKTRAGRLWRELTQCRKECISPDSRLGQLGFATPFEAFPTLFATHRRPVPVPWEDAPED